MSLKEIVQRFKIVANEETTIKCCNSLVLSIALSSILKHTEYNSIIIEEEK